MDVREWRPAVIASSKFEAPIIVDLLRNDIGRIARIG